MQLQCGICGKFLKSKDGLRKHMKWVCPLSPTSIRYAYLGQGIGSVSGTGVLGYFARALLQTAVRYPSHIRHTPP